MIRFLCPQLIGRDVDAADFDGGGHTIGYADDRAAVLSCHVDAGGCGAQLVADPDPAEGDSVGEN
jgi:hypothetical protein